MTAGTPIALPGARATPLVIGVTSHRDIAAAETGEVRRGVAELFSILRRDFPSLPLVVVSALAAGGDQLVAEEALKASAELVAVLPMPRAQYTEDFTDVGTRARFEALCAKATVIDLSLLPDDAGEIRTEAPIGAERDRRYARAGIYVSSHCHLMLTIWDGKPSDRIGGTAQTLDYHLHGTRPDALARSRSRLAYEPLGNDADRLAYHIVASRAGEGGAPAAPLRPLQAFWLTGRAALPASEPMPAAFRTAYAHMGEFNDDALKYQREFDVEMQTRSPSADMLASMSDPVSRLFQSADWLARHFQRRVLFAMRTIYTLAALMGIAFMCYSDLPAQDYMIFVFLGLFVLGGSISAIAHRRGWHRKYLDYRALAEGLRVQAYWRRAGLSITHDAEFAHDNFLQKQDIELGWIRNVMRSAGLEGDLARPPRDDAALARVIAEWVGESGGSSGQLGYYERRAAQRSRLHRITEMLGAISLWVGISISVFLAAFVMSLSQDAKTVLVAIMAALSIVAAVREAYAYRKADKELIKQYRFMCRIFSAARAALDRTRDPAEQREILRALGEAALAEHAEWTLMHRERPLEHARF